PHERLRTVRSAGMRYRGQSYEVDVPVTALRTAADLAGLIQRFHDAHSRRYGHMAQNEAVEMVNFQVTAVAAIPRPSWRKVATGAAGAPKPRDVRPAYFAAGEALPTSVFRRAELAPGITIDGPAIIEEKTSTTVLYPAQSAEVDDYLNLEISLAAAGS